ncbi:MAG: HEAT repeat domain-containing protein [Phycisphaeraceae bacterium]
MIDQVFEQIEAMGDVTVDRALAAALPTADRAALGRIARLVLKRGEPVGTIGLVLHFHRLPEATQREVVAHVPELYRPLREASSRTRSEGPANVIEIVHRSANPHLAYLVADQLRHAAPSLRAAAAACLRELAERAATSDDPEVYPKFDAAAAGYIASALDDAVRAFARHEQERVLLAAMAMLPRPVPGLASVLEQDRRHPAIAAAVRLIERAEHWPACRAAVALLGVETLRKACVAGLRAAAASGRAGSALAHYHLLGLPAIGRVLARVDRPQTLLPNSDELEHLPAHEARGLPAWLAAVGLEPATRVEQLAGLVALPDAAARLFALRRLMQLADDAAVSAAAAPPAAGLAMAMVNAPAAGGDGGGTVAGRGETVRQAAHDAVACFCDDAELATARLAVRYLIARRYAGLSRLLARLLNSPHAPLRRIAADQLGPVGFSRLWDLWPRLEESRRLAAAQALIKIDPNFHRQLADRLRVDDRKTRLRALSIIHGLNQGPFFEAALTELAASADEVVASAAVRALGSAESPEAVESLEAALEHPDARVRANAVEALSQVRSTRHVQTLVQMATADKAARPRANAIDALLQMRTSDAIRGLSRMLADPRPGHRASALWLVQQAQMLTLARHVAEMSLGDPDTEIRQRARAVIRELLEPAEQSETGLTGAAGVAGVAGMAG